MCAKACMTRSFVGTSHSECFVLGGYDVALIHADGETKTQIVDAAGNICNFPGVEVCDALAAEWGSREIAPRIQYSASFQEQGEGFRMIWTIRPDGRYWMDSWGFGEEDEDSVELYTYIDGKGNFTAPFRLYSIGCRYFDGRSEGRE